VEKVRVCMDRMERVLAEYPGALRGRSPAMDEQLRIEQVWRCGSRFVLRWAVCHSPEDHVLFFQVGIFSREEDDDIRTVEFRPEYSRRCIAMGSEDIPGFRDAGLDVDAGDVPFEAAWEFVQKMATFVLKGS
jgi:hypothetical protein